MERGLILSIMKRAEEVIYGESSKEAIYGERTHTEHNEESRGGYLWRVLEGGYLWKQKEAIYGERTHTVCHLDAEALPLEVVCKDGCPNRVSFVSQQLHQGLELMRPNLPSRVRVKLSPNQLEPKKVGLQFNTRQKI